MPSKSKEARTAASRRYRATEKYKLGQSYKNKLAKKRADAQKPENKIKRNRQQALWRASPSGRASMLAYNLRNGKAQAGEIKGSVLHAAAPTVLGRDILAAVTAAVPRYDESVREEIIAEACMHVVEGMSLADAVARARDRTRRDAKDQRRTRPIDGCHWL